MKQRKLEAMFYSLIWVCAVVVLAAGHLYGQEVKYDELVVGLTTWSGYPKKADMQVVQIFLIGTVTCYFAFLAILKRAEAFGEEQKKGFRFLKTVSLVFVCSVFSGKSLWMEIGIVFLLCILVFFALGKEFTIEGYKEVLVTALCSYLSMTAVFGGVSMFADFEQRLLLKKATLVLWSLSLIAPALCIVLFRKKEQEKAKKLSAAIRLFLPLAFLGCYTFYYRTAQGVVVQLFYSTGWKLCCIAAAFVLLCMEGYRFYKKNYVISPGTLIFAGLLRISILPDGILNVDFFHMGEMTLPMQQFVSYGKIPYSELVPIHGMCDYFYQLWNYLFFDGTYLSFNGAMIIGNIVFVVLYAVLFFVTIKDKSLALFLLYGFIPFFVEQAGMRYVCVFSFFLLMFSDKIKKSSIRYLWWWVFLSIVAIAWNASLGGAAALGFLPAVLYKLIRQAPKELSVIWKEKRKQLFFGYGVLFILGISFLPLFLQIVTYLKENTGTTLYVNGMEMLEDIEHAADYFVPGFLNSQGTFFLKAFCVLAAIGICLYYSAYLEAVTLVVGMIIFMNYAYVRYEDGLRAGILGTFFVLLTLMLVMREKVTEKGAAGRVVLVFLTGFLLISSNDSILLGEQVLAYGEIPDSISTVTTQEEGTDALVYVEAGQTGIANMGTGFVRGSTLKSLMDIQHVLSQTLEGETEYLDLTNGIAQTVILNAESVITYTSGYNISNNKMNESAIAQLEEKPPKLILIAPYIKLDDVPLSLRSMKLYEYIMNQGYEPYQYEDVIYMVKGENKVEGSISGREAFANLMHREYLAKLPAVWANASEVQKLEKADISYTARDTADGTVFTLEEKPSGNSISYILISIRKEAREKLSDKEKITLMFQEHAFRFDVVDGQYLIPVGSSPYWKWQESLDEITICQDMGLTADEFELSFFEP